MSTPSDWPGRDPEDTEAMSLSDEERQTIDEGLARILGKEDVLQELGTTETAPTTLHLTVGIRERFEAYAQFITQYGKPVTADELMNAALVAWLVGARDESSD